MSRKGLAQALSSLPDVQRASRGVSYHINVKVCFLSLIPASTACFAPIDINILEFVPWVGMRKIAVRTS